MSMHGLGASLLLIAALATPLAAATAADQTRCTAPTDLTAIPSPLPRSAARVANREPLTIIALGSSSTQGVGATTPAQSYPARLEAELRARFPDWAIKVINRGRGGEDVSEELGRLKQDVIDVHPDLVIWQLGTNAVLRRDDLVADSQQIEQGVDLLKASGTDVVLMDLQFAPRVLDRPTYPAMEKLLADTAKSENIGLFRRFDLMRHWQAAAPADATALVGADGLHMTDAGYGCLAATLAHALTANWNAASAVAASQPGTKTLARLGTTKAGPR